LGCYTGRWFASQAARTREKERREACGLLGSRAEKKKMAEERKASWGQRRKGEGRRGLGFFFLNSFQILFQALQTSLKQ
jgi:hypothetical protein